MVSRSTGQRQDIGSLCTTYAGANVQISVPGGGTVVVTAVVRLAIDHAFGTDDTVYVVVASSTADCGLNAETGVVLIPSQQPTGGYSESVTVLRAFSVASAGTLTFYVNSMMTSGTSLGDAFSSASVVAVYYPA